MPVGNFFSTDWMDTMPIAPPGAGYEHLLSTHVIFACPVLRMQSRANRGRRSESGPNITEM